MQKITIIIAEPQKLVRQSIIAMLNSNDQFHIVADTDKVDDIVSLNTSLSPDLIILDTKMGGADGTAPLIKSILKIRPSVRIICLSNHNNSQEAREMFEQGALGFLSKNASAEHLIKAIIEVNTYNRYICEEIKADFLTKFLTEDKKTKGLNSLTKREQDIISYINKSLSSKEIASILSISIKTVEAHRYNIYKKLEIKKATSLINYMRHKASA